MTETAADAALDQVLAALAGPDAVPKDDQRTAVRAVAEGGGRVLVVQATGWGKSAVYFAATVALRGAGAGPTLVVSPLIALMRDQVSAAARAGLSAAALTSANVDDWPAVEARLLAGEIDLLLVSPERLANPRFASQVLARLLPVLGCLVLDEAHALSDWGHDFRPDYQRLVRLLAARPDLPVLATTATANGRVTADVAAQLGQATVVLRGPLARQSLSLAVVPGLSALQRYAWVAQALAALPGSGIVYALTVADTERLAEFLHGQGLDVAAYHGQLDTDVRQRLEDRLRANRVKALVATSALGMGYDKPDLAFCVHVGSPASPVSYYQQVGRAGRALPDAAAVLLPAETDEGLWRYFATANTPDPRDVDRILGVLDEAAEPLTVPALEVAAGVRRGRLEATLRLLAVDGAVERTASGWASTGARWQFDAPRYSALEAGRAAEADLMRRYAGGEGCLMAFLRQALDDPHLAGDGRCGRCSVCTGTLPAGLDPVPDPALVEAARVFARGRDTALEPRKMWPRGLSQVAGRIALEQRAEAGRALAFADDPGWDQVVPPLLNDTPYGPAADQPSPTEVLDGVVELLARWRAEWDVRPVAVVPVPSRSRPLLVASLAAHIGAVGRLPVLDVLEVAGPRPPRDVSSAARADALLGVLDVRDGAVLPDGPLLLVDDYTATGWTLTVAAALLRRAGSGPVLPLVLHKRP
jgi:ATP-dependent DNA helicase RecQ